MNRHQAVWLDCQTIGCESGMAVDARHIDNLSSGGWLCRKHESEPPC